MMKMKIIANNVALQTNSYFIHGYTQIKLYFYDGYNRKEIFKGSLDQFFYNGEDKYSYCKVNEIDTQDNILCIGIEE